jgi:hypothetical protein
MSRSEDRSRHVSRDISTPAARRYMRTGPRCWDERWGIVLEVSLLLLRRLPRLSPIRSAVAATTQGAPAATATVLRMLSKALRASPAPLHVKDAHLAHWTKHLDENLQATHL